MSFEVIDTQEKLDEIIGQRLARQKETLEAAYATKLKEQTDKVAALTNELSGKRTELEQLKAKEGEANKQIEGLKNDVANLGLATLRGEIAYKHGLPFELAGRLQGQTKEEIEADAEKLSDFITKPPQTLKDTEPEGLEGDNLTSAYRALVQNLKI